MSNPEFHPPIKGVMEIEAFGICRIIDGAMWIDFGGTHCVPFLIKSGVEELEQKKQVKIDGERVCIRVAFLDIPETTGQRTIPCERCGRTTYRRRHRCETASGDKDGGYVCKRCGSSYDD